MSKDINPVTKCDFYCLNNCSVVNVNKLFNGRFSGITPKMMEPVTTTLQDVQHKIKSLLPKDAILCGQSLNFDLDSLKVYFPSWPNISFY